MQISQTNFSDGLDFLSASHQIAANGYYYLVNARQRLGEIEPNKKPIEVTTIPEGKKQGIISLGNILIAFISGKAWYNIDESDIWTQISNFNMSATVDRYYSIAVPVGNIGYLRKLNDAGVLSIKKTYEFAINGTPASIVVQDGINQPWIIIYEVATGTFTSRVTKGYVGWLNTAGGREYVPIGKQMMIVDAKLYIVSADSKNIYHSISGRYLDFMVNVDTDGNKLATEAQGGAISVSFNFDADDITCVTPVGIPSSFLYGTTKNTRIITLDYTNTIFGEPTYYVAEGPMSLGVVNQDSVVDILGDTAVIDFEGVKSFNAVKQLKVEGNNSIFSLQLSKLLKGKKQYRCRAVSFNNFVLFNLDTTWSNIFAIYDTLLQRWVALDITDVYAVKQFTEVITDSTRKLYAINVEDKLFQLYASDEVEVAQLHTKAFCATVNAAPGFNAGQPEVTYAQKGEYLKLSFVDGTTPATVAIVEMADGKKSLRLTKDLPSNLAGFGFPMIFPIIFNSTQTSEPLTFNLAPGIKGHKLTYVVMWNSDAKLQALSLKTSDEIPTVSLKEQDRILTR